MKNFYPVNHEFFKSLGFRDQVKIVSIYLHDLEQYNLLLVKHNFVDKVKKVKEDTVFKKMSLLSEIGSRELPKSYDLPIQFVRHWVSYHTRYSHRQFQAFDANVLDIHYHNVINVKLFDFPIMILDKRTKIIWDWVHNNYKSVTSKYHLLYTLYLRIIADELGAPDDNLTGSHTLGRYVKYINNYVQLNTIRRINGYYPIIVDDKSLWPASKILNPPPPMYLSGGKYLDYKPGGNSVEVSGNFGILNKARHIGDHFYMPVVPEFFYIRDRSFCIQDWQFLR